MDLLIAANSGGGYVAAAYLAFILLLVVYLAIMANKLVKMQRRVSELSRKVDGDNASE